VDKMRENKLRWFGHVMRRDDLKALRNVMALSVERRRPKKKWMNAIECDMRFSGVCK